MAEGRLLHRAENTVWESKAETEIWWHCSHRPNRIQKWLNCSPITLFHSSFNCLTSASHTSYLPYESFILERPYVINCIVIIFVALSLAWNLMTESSIPGGLLYFSIHGHQTQACNLVWPMNFDLKCHVSLSEQKLSEPSCGMWIFLVHFPSALRLMGLRNCLFLVFCSQNGGDRE